MASSSIGERVSQRKRRSSLSTENNHNIDKGEEESPLHHFHGLCEDYHRVLGNTVVEYYDVIIPNVLNQAQFYVRQTTFPFKWLKLLHALLCELSCLPYTSATLLFAET